MVAKAWWTSRTNCTATNARRCATASIFSNFYLDYGLASIAWLDGADFAPEFLYEKLKAMN